MKNQIAILTLCLASISCDTSSDLTTNADSIVGFWSKETVYLNGVNSNQYVDFLNNGTNFLEINKDRTFTRAYDIGRWDLSHKTLTFDRENSSGIADWKYKVIEQVGNNLILEIRLTEGEYCCDFNGFADEEIITIREVYKRQD